MASGLSDHELWEPVYLNLKAEDLSDRDHLVSYSINDSVPEMMLYLMAGTNYHVQPSNTNRIVHNAQRSEIAQGRHLLV